MPIKHSEILHDTNTQQNTLQIHSKVYLLQQQLNVKAEDGVRLCYALGMTDDLLSWASDLLYVEVTGLVLEDGYYKNVIFPEAFSGRVPVQLASPCLLSYYEATIKKGALLSDVLEYRYPSKEVLPKEEGVESMIPSFHMARGDFNTWGKQFCPMEAGSGIFVLLKFLDDEKTRVHISGFRIPVGHTLLISKSSSVFFTDDYLKGIWRKDGGMRCYYEVPMKKGTIENNIPFHFTFA